ncbi:hypothetical protein DMB66_38825 [Actinoplanes sp. ATCC 53533]|uniref:hypothetical protein n=1 Tax=Actinoplanes sp. ATCC 53533 TaxID=1288362 RepID=UPI000F77C8B8|nr:hypothetical protein [Actinoplanes sp. ATCC 53533]RSM53434.1 hypothetical protein DMB66_38825 [Actinoplanes sp. ATCC 53533]
MDHLTALFMAPESGGGRGAYRPGGFDLRLDGDVADRLVHHHEAQHVLLTSTTAWGVALVFTATRPDGAGDFDTLLAECKGVHELYATYLSCSVVAAGDLDPATVLRAYPEYEPLVQELDGHLAAVPGMHRRSLAATALARACMQTPILETMTDAWPGFPALADLRRMDRPGERLSLLMREPLSDEVVAAADSAAGPEAVDADEGTAVAALDDRFDDAWARWEDAVFDAYAARLAAAGATVIPGNEHLPAAAALVARSGSDLSVVAAPVEDERMVATVLRHARLWLTTQRRPARAITLGADVDLDELVRVAEATTRVAGRPNLVIAARLPERLLGAYELPVADRERLAAHQGPVVVVRTVADDGTDTGTDAVWLVGLPEPADLAALAEAWATIGDLTCCVAASCLRDSGWRDRWLPVLERTAPLVWLIDVGIAVLAGEWRDRTVHSLYLDLGPSGTGASRAVAVKAEGLVGVWLAVADEVGVQMITAQVADQLPALQTTGADWSELLPPVRLALLDLLRVESYVDLRALSDHRG